nr:MAG TPA: hypothetical protein [Caudoviricetes sp.]
MNRLFCGTRGGLTRSVCRTGRSPSRWVATSRPCGGPVSG